MHLEVRTAELRFREPFATARGVRTHAEVVHVRLVDGDDEGWGEGAPATSLPDTAAGAATSLESLDPAELAGAPADVAERLGRRLSGSPSAASAAVMAVLDLAGRRTKVPLHALWGGATRPGPPFCRTIGAGTVERIASDAARVADAAELKLKVAAGGDDEAAVRAVRRASRLPLRVDANGGWSSRDAAARAIERFASLGVAWVEQPLPPGRLDDVAWLAERSALPLVADEEIADERDVAAAAGIYRGINLKLDVQGGLWRCRSLLAAARSADLAVFVGCTGASSLGNTAAAHLALEADGADLDSHLTLDDDPWAGLRIQHGRIVLPEGPGIGARPRRRAEA